MKRHIASALSLWAVMMLGLAGKATAQDARRFVVSTPAGGGLDTIVRTLSGTQALRSAWGNPIVIENVAGSNGMVAVRTARNLRADGSAMVAVYISEQSNNLVGYAPTLTALEGLVPIAYLGSYTGPSGKSWYGVYGPPGMPAGTASTLEAALQQAMQGSELAALSTKLPGYQQDRPVSAASLRAAATQTASAARQAMPPAAAADGSATQAASSGETLCDVAGDEWTDRQRGETREKYPFLAYLRVSNKRIDKLVHEFDLDFFARCAADEAEFQDRTQWIVKGLESIREHTGIVCGGILGSGGPADEGFKGLFNDEYIRNYNCDNPVPEGFEEWFAKYRENARIALDSARSRMKAPQSIAAVSAEDAACAASLKDIDGKLESARRDIPRDSIVVLSEATLWALTESISSIKQLCPQSPAYRSRLQALQATWYETQRACNGHATRTCTARLPSPQKSPPAPVAASALKPLERKPPAACDEGTGSNWAKCLAGQCAAQGGEFSMGECASCAVPGSSWTVCPKGSSGVSSGQ